jgi:type IV pilus secretin PilQ/predicted competence protein
MIADCRMRIADWHRRLRSADWPGGLRIADGRRIAMFVALAAFGGTIALMAGPAPMAEPAPIRLVGVSLQGRAVVIEAAEPVGYAVSRPDPLTIVVELRDVSIAEAANQVRRHELVAGVSLEQGTAADGKSVGRVRVALTGPAESKVRSARNTIRLELTPAPTAAREPRTVAPPVNSLLPNDGGTATTPVLIEPRAATTIESVQASTAANAATITLAGNGKLTPTNVSEAADKPRRIVFDFAGVGSQAAPQTAVDSPLVSKVRVAVNSRTPLLTRVVMEIAEHASYHVERSGLAGRDLSVVVEGRVTVTPAADPDVISLNDAIKNAAPLTPPEPVGVDPMAALKTAPPFVAAPKQTQTPPPPPPVVEQPRPAPMAPATGQQIGGTQPKKYVGHLISFDFAGADLRTVLRVFSDTSGLNILIDPQVPNTPQDLVLKDIPWDQAMEIVLRANQLGYEVEGTVIRIAPLKVLEDEQKARAALTAAQANAGPLSVQTFSLSYAKAEQLSPLIVKSTLSQRGQIQVDPRTNTLIITDLAERLQTTADLIRTLDRPEPQVEVEARVVQTTRDFARALGIQWGLNGRMTPEIGNTTNLAFPNRGTLGGRVGGQQGGAGTDVRANPNDQTGTAVNLGVPGASSAIGLALGAVNGAFNLDVALSALESSGKGRVLSTPRLTTQNNVSAEIAQGIEIPIQTISNNTVTVTFKDATLKLMVTPQITAAGTVIMQIEIQNATPDFSREVNGIPPIDTQRASTRVQVDDGATTVIGGIFVSREQASSDRTPFLSRVPLLGWLFRRDSLSDESRELLIFITPRIIR